MDKTVKYQEIIIATLKEYGAIKPTTNIRKEVIIDREHNHFQLLSVGWHNGKFTYTISFHFDLIDEKIWIQQNNTDVLIADELIERGVNASDIVLGFLPEEVRHLVPLAA
jgi:hypothetical protein